MAQMLITPITRGGSFLILQDVMGWATGFFIPFLGESQQKNRLHSNRFCRPTLPPVLYDQSLSKSFAIWHLHKTTFWKDLHIDWYVVHRLSGFKVSQNRKGQQLYQTLAITLENLRNG